MSRDCFIFTQLRNFEWMNDKIGNNIVVDRVDSMQYLFILFFLPNPINLWVYLLVTDAFLVTLFVTLNLVNYLLLFLSIFPLFLCLFISFFLSNSLSKSFPLMANLWTFSFMFLWTKGVEYKEWYCLFHILHVF